MLIGAAPEELDEDAPAPGTPGPPSAWAHSALPATAGLLRHPSSCRREPPHHRHVQQVLPACPC
eukprot:3355002-Heterocapsa_arctica.AAC.1